MGISLVASQIASALGSFEPQKRNIWTIEIPGVLQSDILELSLRQGFLPTETNEEHEIPLGNERVYYAGKARYEAGTIICGDYVDRDIASIISQWRTTVYDPATGIVNYASVYKKQASIVVAASDGTLQRVWNLLGCWPEAVHYGDLDMSNAEQVLISVTLRYDKALNVGSFATSLPTLSPQFTQLGA